MIPSTLYSFGRNLTTMKGLLFLGVFSLVVCLNLILTARRRSSGSILDQTSSLSFLESQLVLDESQCKQFGGTSDDDSLEGQAIVHNFRELEYFTKTQTGKFGVVFPVVVLVNNRVEYLEVLLKSLQNVTNNQHMWFFFSLATYFRPCVDAVIRFNLNKSVLFFPCYFIESMHPRMKLKYHWYWILSLLFNSVKGTIPFEHIMVLEDDLVVAMDIYETALALLETTKRFEALQGIYDINLYRFNTEKDCSLESALITTAFESYGYVISRYTFSQVEKNFDLFLSCEDGWDWSVRLLRKVGLIPKYSLQPCISRTQHRGETGIHLTPEIYKEERHDKVVLSDASSLSMSYFHILEYNQADESNLFSKCYNETVHSNIRGPFLEQKVAGYM